MKESKKVSNLEEEAIFILTKMKIEHYFKNKGQLITMTYEQLLDYTIKTLKLIERIREE